MTDRCTGHCCERFTLPFTPRELQAALAESKRRDSGQPPDLEVRVPVDIEIIAPMVIHLGAHSFDPASRQPAGKNLEHYTCKHLDRETRDCRIYATRPAVCREYPYGARCTYATCTSVEARDGRMGRPWPLPVLQPDQPDQLAAEGPR